MRILLSLSLIFFIFQIGNAQAVLDQNRDDGYIVQFENEQQADQYLHKHQISITESQLISKSLLAYHFKLSSKNAYASVQDHQYLSLVKNEAVNYRAVPNDDLFTTQWNLELLEIEKAWDISTGGISPNGDTIVIAILDSGCDVNHEDIVDNLWKNKLEIPNDNIDNDGNNYVDDYVGLNLDTGDDKHRSDNHGTPVTGIIGATGNNLEGISGINWNIKLMILSNVRTVAEIIEAYQYVIDQREKYDASNGEEGAYVVATNFSAGIANRFPSDFPTWCAMFDELGQAGILNVCSVANSNINVDDVGDLPTLCTSPYLIAVTNTNRQDIKVSSAGFGMKNVDLGAPGESAPSTFPNNQYQNFNGTSCSAPHVSGVIGLLFSADVCDKFSSLIKEEKAAAALLVKELILSGTDPLPSLNNITVSGGRLNAFKALFRIDAFCNNESQDLEIKVIYPNPASDQLNIEYRSPSANNITMTVLNMLGQKVMEESLFPSFIESGMATVNVQNFAQGTYLIRLESGDMVLNRKIVVVR